MGRSDYSHVYQAPLDSPTFVQIPLTGMDSQGPSSCCGEASKPTVDYLTNKWNVFLVDHIPQPVFDAMMHDIYNGPKFQTFLRTYYSPAGSLCGVLFCICIAVPCLIMAHSRMKAEVGQKLAAWNRVFTKQGCGVTMQINEHGLVFNISPQHTLQAEGDAQDDELIRELGLNAYDSWQWRSSRIGSQGI